jgi:AcrR family transcriptional regulator
LAHFSARDVAKRVGYSIGTLYNVFGSYDGLMLAINGRTLTLWAAHLRARLAQSGEDRIATLVRGYFEFANQNAKSWIAIFEHRMADGGAAPAWYQSLAADLMSVVADEIAAVLPTGDPAPRPLACRDRARSLRVRLLHDLQHVGRVRAGRRRAGAGSRSD